MYELQAAGIDTTPEKEIIALIAYLQKLGTGLTLPASPAGSME